MSHSLYYYVSHLILFQPASFPLVWISTELFHSMMLISFSKTIKLLTNYNIDQVSLVCENGNVW